MNGNRAARAAVCIAWAAMCAGAAAQQLQDQEAPQPQPEDSPALQAAVEEATARLKLTPKESPTSRDLVASATATRAALAKKSGADFDRAYVDNEVAYHAAVLDMLDETLVPAARNHELKSLLESVRPAFVAHLEHARMIQSELR